MSAVIGNWTFAPVALALVVAVAVVVAAHMERGQ